MINGNPFTLTCTNITYTYVSNTFNLNYVDLDSYFPSIVS